MGKFLVKFKNKDQVKSFREPLTKIGFAEGVGIVLRLDNKNVRVNAVSETNNILAQVEMDAKKVFDSIKIEGELEVGILEFGNFLSCFDMFGEEFSMAFDGEKFIFQDKAKSSKLEYFATRTDAIRECDKITPKKFGSPYAKFELAPQNIARIIKAFSVLGEDLLKVTSSKDEGDIKISIANKGKSNSYSFSVPVKGKIAQGFDMYYSHDHLSNLFKGNNKIDLTVTEKALIGIASTKEYSIRYYISRRS